jgi:hypothetical protein
MPLMVQKTYDNHSREPPTHDGAARLGDHRLNGLLQLSEPRLLRTILRNIPYIILPRHVSV